MEQLGEAVAQGSVAPKVPARKPVLAILFGTLLLNMLGFGIVFR